MSPMELSFVLLALTTLSSSQGFTQQGGRTRLLGSSFGILGLNATFDYVIIGGGTAGLTVANRLAKNPQLTVAVVEGGSFYEIDNSNYSQIPAYDVQFSSPDPASIQPLVDWGIVTSPQAGMPLLLLTRNSNCKIVGYIIPKENAWAADAGPVAWRSTDSDRRGTRGSYQRWATQVGDQSFSFENLLPYFQKSPSFTPPDYAKRGPGNSITDNQDAFSTTGGPLQVSYTNFYQPFSTYIQRALQALGLKKIAGLNSGSLLGFSEFTLTVDPKAGTRSSSETSFLQDAIATSTLQVYQKTIAKRIVFDGDKNAEGVLVETAGVQYLLTARKEVILSAGVFRSPQMLMVSGVGPSATLQKFSLPIVSALEGVGQGMQDQPYYTLAYKVNVSTNSQLLINPAFVAQATEDFLTSQTGPLSSPGGNWVGWEKLPGALRDGLSNATISDLSNFPSDWPEIELLPIAGYAAPATSTDNYAAVSIAILVATSRGNVTISSIDTNDNPFVSTNWLLTQTDQEVAIAAFKRARQLAAATDITIGPEVLPGTQIQTDEQILDFVRGTVGPIHHASATCKSSSPWRQAILKSPGAMGKRDDPNAVVDPAGKVYGVKGLRVVDASAFPLLPPGHPQASVCKALDQIS
ncbi:MAG: hypothetical protein Q9170_003984 [Blastenia crenularia]